MLDTKLPIRWVLALLVSLLVFAGTYTLVQLLSD